jgi:hypothetical protein
MIKPIGGPAIKSNNRILFEKTMTVKAKWENEVRITPIMDLTKSK